MQNFNDKIVVITGAASGMGRAYAVAFAKLGSRLALNDYNQSELDKTAKLVREASSKEPLLSAFDVSDRDAMYAFSAQVKQTFGNADVLINNAGVEGGAQSTWELADEDYERQIKVNFFSVVHGTRAFLPQMLEADSGVIVNVSSVFGLIGTPHQSDYCAAKFAVRGFTEALMVELIESKIQVHLLHPGGIATNIAQLPQQKKFEKEFLTTSPDDIAQHLIQCIGKNKKRIVYGNQSLKIWLAEKYLPLKMRCRLIWKEMLKTLDLKGYSFLNKQN